MSTVKDPLTKLILTVAHINSYTPLYDPSFHFTFHSLFHLILHCRGHIPKPCTLHNPNNLLILTLTNIDLYIYIYTLTQEP